MAQTLNYSSAAVPTVLAAPLGLTGNPQVSALAGYPSSYPYKILVDWGNFGAGQTQEAMYVTGPPTGTGPFTLPVTRGADNTTAGTHLIGAPVEHGVTAEDFLLNPFGQQILATQRSAALTPWYAALANRAQARANVICVGDSITEGEGATAWDNGWVHRLRDLLRARYPTNGLAAGTTAGGRGYINCKSSGSASITWPTTITGSPPQASNTPKGSAGVQFNGSGQSVSYSLTGDTADIMWQGVPFGGTFSYKIDSASAVNISTNFAPVTDGKITHVTLGAAGAHTLLLSWVSGNANFDGVIEYNTDFAAGIQVHDCGHFGWQTNSWTGAASGTYQCQAALSPALVLITLGVNDQFSNVVPATYQANLQAIISDIKAQLTAPYPAFVLNMLPPRLNQANYTYPWAQYVAAAYAVAAADTSGPAGVSLVTVMDFTLGPRMPGADTDTYSLWAAGNLVHPSNKGHEFIADAVCQFISQP